MMRTHTWLPGARRNAGLQLRASCLQILGSDLVGVWVPGSGTNQTFLTYYGSSTYLPSLGSAKTVLVVATPTALPVETTTYLVSSSNGPTSEVLGVSAAASTWYGVVEGYAYYRDGASQNNLATGSHVYEASISTTQTEVTVGGLVTYGGSYQWLGTFRAIVLAATQLTTAQRAAITPAILRF